MLALIDGDLIAYRCAASAENDPLIAATSRVEELCHTIMNNTQSDKFMMYLTGKGNYRKQISTSYKANRKDTPKPKWLNDCRRYLQENWNAVTAIGVEADDLLGIEQCTTTDDKTVICSLDKDLLMIPGDHYNWTRDTFQLVTHQESIKTFYKQLLIGDTSDNVTGVRGLGPKKSAKIIDPLETEEEMLQTVRELYEDDTMFVHNALLLWIMREEGELWHHRTENIDSDLLAIAESLEDKIEEVEDPEIQEQIREFDLQHALAEEHNP